MVIVGIKNCEKCQAKKEELKKAGTAFDYVDFKDLSLISQRKISRNFRTDQGAIDFPVLIEDRQAYKIEIN